MTLEAAAKRDRSVNWLGQTILDRWLAAEAVRRQKHSNGSLNPDVSMAGSVSSRSINTMQNRLHVQLIEENAPAQRLLTQALPT
jgi:hypothetical protein